MRPKVVALILFVAVSAFCAEMKGQKIPDQAEVGGKKLVLNGMGMRKKTIFAVDVYIGALYLEKKSKNPNEILNSTQLKRVELTFVHNADAGKIREGWDEARKDNCSSGCETFNSAFDQLTSKMTDMKVGDRMTFDIYPNKVAVWVNGRDVGMIEVPGFSKQVLVTWLGDHPPTEELKSGMLGQK